MNQYDIPDRPIPSRVDNYDTDDLIIGTCAACGDPIYKDVDYYQIDFEKVHVDCIDKWAEQYRVRSV